jgi:HD-like signal output (HDOD) protein
MDKNVVFETIANQVAQGDLVFSTGAQVALKLRRALDDPDCHVNTATRLIQAEPLLATRVIAIANSVVYNRSGREIADVHMAVSLLGFQTIRSLAMALVTRQMAGKSKNPVRQALVDKLWEHSAHVASLAHAIARHVTHLDPEAALFSGIIHEIGGFYMLSRADDFPGLLEGDFSEWLEGGEIKVGRAVLGKLKVPASVTAVIESFWDGFLAMPPVTLADTLLLAEELAPVPSPLHRLDNKAPESENKVVASIEMVIGEETLSLILKESAEEIGSLTRALQF